uniref:S1-like domain-containing protein n=1 Tax=Dunaliella tertiolecta TaxID=3047 RepID=A0A7S3VQX6_DUNTE|mmetsp:Transcript_18502/g.51924  ORF Transcript_18502/g.51924 Transcript_18502/m.51924 type:complete len:356 (-) Transcript_18502:268-1335(-)
MSRRKHLIQELERDLPPLGEEHEVVKVVAPRGGSIVDVERADGTRSLCLMPKKFNRTLWVKRDGFLLIERADGVPPLQPSASPSGVEQRRAAGTADTADRNNQHPASTSGSAIQGEVVALAEPTAAAADAQPCPQGSTPSADHTQPSGQNQHGDCGNRGPEDSSNLGPPPSQTHPALSPSAPAPAAGHSQQAPGENSMHSAATGSRKQDCQCHGAHPSQTGPHAPPDAQKEATPQIPSHAAKPAVGTAGGAAVRSSQPAAQGSKIMGTIVAVLYDEQIKQLKKTPGAWPPEFGHKGAQVSTIQVAGEDAPPERNNNGSDDDSEDGLPPLEKNMNRRIIVHDNSDDDEDESDDDES